MKVDNDNERMTVENNKVVVAEVEVSATVADLPVIVATFTIFGAAICFLL